MASDPREWVPVAVVEMHGEPGKLYVDASDGWQALRDEVLGGWDPPKRDDLTIDPAAIAPPFTIQFTAMQRFQLDALPEHGGW